MPTAGFKFNEKTQKSIASKKIWKAWDTYNRRSLVEEARKIADGLRRERDAESPMMSPAPESPSRSPTPPPLLTISATPELHQMAEGGEAPMREMELSDDSLGNEAEQLEKDLKDAMAKGDMALLEELFAKKASLNKPKKLKTKKTKKEKRATSPRGRKRTNESVARSVKVAITPQEKVLVDYLTENFQAEYYPINLEEDHQFYEMKVRGYADHYVETMAEALLLLIHTCRNNAGAGSILKDKRGWTIRQRIGGKDGAREQPYKTKKIVNGGEYFLGWSCPESYFSLTCLLKEAYCLEEHHTLSGSRKEKVRYSVKNADQLFALSADEFATNLSGMVASENLTQEKAEFKDGVRQTPVAEVEEEEEEEQVAPDEVEDSDSDSDDDEIEVSEEEYEGEKYLVDKQTKKVYNPEDSTECEDLRWIGDEEEGEIGERD